MRLTFLGTGTSVGIPMIGCECPTCTSSDPRDKRLRTGLLIEHEGKHLVVDLSADFRQQALRAGLNKLDAILITHCHADHVFGLDDIRPLNFRFGAIPVYASSETWDQLRRVFYYIFEAKHIGGGLPQIIPKTLEDKQEICGLMVDSIDVIHGGTTVQAFRFSDNCGELAFVTDCNLIPEASLDRLRGLDLLIIDALRLKPHSTHLHLEKTLSYIEELRPRRSILIHMSHDIRHEVVGRSLPDGVELGFDGLQIEL
jgi:phosphoribosyl 1,2-cyclic phosphate phosphodiesterase